MLEHLVVLCGQLTPVDLVCLFVLLVFVFCLSSYIVDTICDYYYKEYATCVAASLLHLITSIRITLDDSDFAGQKFYLMLNWNPKLTRTRKFYMDDRQPLAFKSFGFRKHLVVFLGSERVTRQDIIELLDFETLKYIHCDSDGLYVSSKNNDCNRRT